MPALPSLFHAACCWFPLCSVRYSRSLEESFFRGRALDFLFLLVFGGSLMIVRSLLTACLLDRGAERCVALLQLFGPFVKVPFFGESLSFMMVYIWARRNPMQRLRYAAFLHSS